MQFLRFLRQPNDKDDPRYAVLPLSQVSWIENQLIHKAADGSRYKADTREPGKEYEMILVVHFSNGQQYNSTFAEPGTKALLEEIWNYAK